MPADPTPWDLAMEAIGDHGCDCDADTVDHLALHTCLAGRCEHALVTTAAERDRALGEVERLRSALEWFADAGHYSNTYRRGAGFVDALGLSRARCALLGIDRDDAPDDLDARWAAREVHRG